MSMNKIRRLLLGSLLLGTGGCTVLPSAPDAADDDHRVKVTQLSFTMVPVPAAPDDGTLAPRYCLEVTDEDPLAHALLLVLRGDPDDEATAQQLLDGLDADPEKQVIPVEELAALLRARLSERQQLRNALAEEQHQRRVLQQQLGVLQRQLDELMNIEQQINRRMQAPAIEVPPS